MKSSNKNNESTSLSIADRLIICVNTAYVSESACVVHFEDKKISLKLCACENRTKTFPGLPNLIFGNLLASIHNFDLSLKRKFAF